MEVLKEDFINPFNSSLDRDKLYNLASGRPLPDSIAEELLGSYERGKEMFSMFQKRLEIGEEEAAGFFDPIKRCPWKGFGDAEKKIKVTAKGKSKDIAVQRDILGLLVASSYEEQSSVDIDKALSFPLAPVPLSLATCDGNRRTTAKSTLLDAELSSIVTELDSLDEAQIYAFDVIAAVRSIGVVPDTFRDLARKLLHNIPSQFTSIYAACDCYLAISIKNAERKFRGEADKFIIKTPDIRIPPDFKRFLSNGDNKERLFELIEEVWVQERTSIGERVIYFARKDKCTKITCNESISAPELDTNHEEADTKVCYLLNHASQGNTNQESTCLLRSSSGDIDIPIILLANEQRNLRIFMDTGTGKDRKLLDLSACDLSNQQNQALLGVHAFTGNDYVSSFLRRGKKVCWKLVQDNQEFLTVFSNLGTTMQVSQQMIAGLSKYVCHLYGEKKTTSVDVARRKIFWRNFSRDSKIVDLSLIPPCSTSLKRHIERANYVARIWRQASDPMMDVDDPRNHGWNQDFDIDWISEAYPEDLAELLVTTNEDVRGGDGDELFLDLSDDDED